MGRRLAGCTGGIVLALASIAPVGAAPQLTGWQFDPTARQLAFFTTGPVQPRVQVVSDPPRVVVDLPSTDFAAPPHMGELPMTGGAVRRIRAGQLDPATARMVMELAEGTPALTPAQVSVRQATPRLWLVQLPPVGLPPAPQSPVTLPPLPPPPVRRVQVGGVQVRPDGFLLRTSGPVRADARRLEELPPRIVVDLEDAQLTLPSSERTLAVNQLGVVGLRIGQFQDDPPIARAVLDLAPDNLREAWEARYVAELGGVLIRPVPGSSATTAIPAGPTVSLLAAQMTPQGLLFTFDQPLRVATNWENPNEYRLVFSPAAVAQGFALPALEGQDLLADLRLVQREDGSVAALLKIPSGVRVGDPLAADAERRQVLVPLWRGVSTSVNVTPGPGPEEVPNGIGTRIVVDAGHGGKDPGAQRGGLNEKDLTFAIARRLNNRLRHLGYNTRMSRPTEDFVTLGGRVEATKAHNAALFVSVHINCMDGGRDDIYGIETYYTHPNSARLAYVLHRHIVAATGKPDRRVRQRGLYVTRMNAVPAVLLEVGFISNPAERAQLNDPEYQEKIAAAIAAGIKEYLEN